MAEVYFYMPVSKTSNAVECGIKLSEWYSRETAIEGAVKKCITALLNPRDDYGKYMSADYKCLKLEIQPKYCYVADSLLYKAGLVYPEVMELYRRSVIPIEKYTFGSYRLPEVLITSTVIGDQITVMGKLLDTPVLYNNSQELYLNNLLEGLQEEFEDMNDTLLYLFFKRLCDESKATCIEDTADRLAVFTYKRDGRKFTIKTPEFGGF